MNVLVITGSLYNMLGGPYHSVRDTCIAFCKKGYKVHIIGTRDSHSQSKDARSYVDNMPGIIVTALKKFGPYNFHFSFDFLFYWNSVKKSDFVSIQSVWQLNCMLVALFAILQNKPFYFAVRGEFNDFTSLKEPHKRIIKPFVNFLFNKSNFLQVLNDREVLQLRNYGCKSKILVIPNAVKQQKLIDLSNKKKQIIYLGRFHPSKGISQLLEAWRSISNKRGWKLILAGDGKKEFKDKILNQVNSENDIKYYGIVVNKEKIELLSSSSWLILPSFMEGMPMVVLESLSFGTPVLITEYCNLPPVFKNNVGLKISTDIDSIRKGIVQAITMKNDEYNKMKKRAVSFIKKKYLWKDVINTIAKEINK